MTTTVPLYTTVPNRSTSPSTFAADMDTRLSEDNPRITAANAQATEVNNSASAAEAAALAAAISAATVGIVAWVSGTTYAINDTRISPADWQVYRRKTDGAGTTDPSADTTNWTPIIRITQPKIALPANNIDLASAGFFTKTISGTTTFTVSNLPASGIGISFILDLTNGGSAAITWFSGVKWTGGVAPTLSTSGRDVLGFMTHDAGGTWVGMLLAKGAA